MFDMCVSEMIHREYKENQTQEIKSLNLGEVNR